MRKLILILLFVFIATPATAQRTTMTHTVVSVLNASTVAVAASNLRNFLILQNDSDTDIYCKFGATAVANEGFRLTANGGALLLDYKFSAQAVNCIHGAGVGKNLLISQGAQ